MSQDVEGKRRWVAKRESIQEMMNLWTYPGFVEPVRKKIDDGKSLMKDLIVGKLR
jgi:hypothetical protein